jgi:hypothetical protein
MRNTDALMEHLGEVGGAAADAIFFRQIAHDGDSNVVRLRGPDEGIDPRMFARWRPTLLDEQGQPVGVCVYAAPALRRRLDLDFLVQDPNVARKLAEGCLSGALIGTVPITKGYAPRTAKLVDHFTPPSATFKYTAAGTMQKRGFSTPAQNDPTIAALKATYAAGPSRWVP